MYRRDPRLGSDHATIMISASSNYIREAAQTETDATVHLLPNPLRRLRPISLKRKSRKRILTCLPIRYSIKERLQRGCLGRQAGQAI